MQTEIKNKNNLEILNKSIIKCNKCPRLVKFRKKISNEKENNISMKNIGENQLLGLET